MKQTNTTWADEPATAVPTGARALPYNIHAPDYEDIAPAAEETRSALEKERADSLQGAYRVGRIIEKHHKKCAEKCDGFESQHSDRFFEHLAAESGFAVGMLRAYHKLVMEFPGKAYDKLCDIPHMSVSMAKRLASISILEDRETLIARVEKEGLTVRELEKAIREMYGRRRKAGAGRKSRVPKNVNAALTNLSTQIDKFVSSSNSIWFGSEYDLGTELAKVPADKLTDEFIAKLGDVVEHLKSLAEIARQNAQTIAGVIPEAERRKNAQAEIEEQILAAEARERLDEEDPYPAGD